MSSAYRWAALWFAAGALAASIRILIMPPPPVCAPLMERLVTPEWAVIPQANGQDEPGTLIECDGCHCYFSFPWMTKLQTRGFGADRWLCPDCLKPVAAHTAAIHGQSLRIVRVQ